ncbi:ABC transporter substrate-binding protein [Bradyrhizobium sp. U87765 SZCCT0131]|uniref:ABC transporter substrate-binding protein n=1 Tax=unclassified Bradyrhizobium TaxID=2631580 RepID=UPI001BADC47A|nr:MULTISPECIES: ABC transporter substrate-binding protein [unclassified Bradyrhizobium]MBR1218819.1 ABC transporter substrate-binding protein [Bradyrhizobium sp. U87765 SZCCT0131]MBR1261470.1 ABC transporter substrate-binding protein [Bradyrhizobium sp. U87765 SZCCT0134]MBR1306677.1 ABC transporter substrate-binding protein [Bradyrhizobium sp. U87765 SZCCT0110]MBR1317252.1 ABC transporter substrate-binding protein [Bradyrhizobium sp. U87765 SZCCT0109]MBR1350954.1 ABC transporter substrate-bin
MRYHRVLDGLIVLTLLTSMAAAGERKYDPGATDSEIKIGQTMPYSGPNSTFGVYGRVQAAYFQKINDDGGINGRKINFISLDDAYSPPKTVEQTRRLVESEQVLLDFSPLGTAPNTAIQKYLNTKKVPQLFVIGGASKWGDPARFHWTMSWQPSYYDEARVFAQQALARVPNPKIAILSQNDDYGRDYVKGIKDELGPRAAELIVKELTYEVTDPSIDSQIISLQQSGANVFMNIAIPKFAAQAIRKASDIDWHPLQFVNSLSSSVGTVLKPAGLEKARGIVTTAFYKDPTDPTWQNDAEYLAWVSFMKKYFPDGKLDDSNNVFGYMLAQTMVQVLKQCGDELTRENVMRQAANLKDFTPAMILPGIRINTSPDNYYPIRQFQPRRFDGERWVDDGAVISR